MCLAGFSLMYIFSYICAKTDSVFLLALCSIFMGFLRMVLMMVNLFTLIKYAGHIEAYDKITPGNEPTTDEGWDKLDIERSAAQPAIYLFFMVLGQLGTSLTAWLAFEYEWQYIHYFMMGLLLLCILITFITMPYHKYTTRRFPINFKQFGNASIFCITLACITYGKVLDWYDDPTIQWATVCAIIAGGIFLYIESTQRNPYYQLDVFKLRTIRMGFLFYFLLMVLNSSAMFVNVFTGIGMKLDNFQNATLGNWSMLGYLIGGIATIWLSVKGVHFKYLFAAGFLLLGLSAMFMYFEVQGAGLYERMKYPVIIRSTAMYRPLQFFCTIGAILFVLGLVVGIRFLVFFFLGEGNGHVQSLILTAVLLLIGFQTITLGLLGDTVAANRKLLEDVQYHVRKMDYDNNPADKTPDDE